MNFRAGWLFGALYHRYKILPASHCLVASMFMLGKHYPDQKTSIEQSVRCCCWETAFPILDFMCLN